MTIVRSPLFGQIFVVGLAPSCTITHTRPEGHTIPTASNSYHDGCYAHSTDEVQHAIVYRQCTHSLRYGPQSCAGHTLQGRLSKHFRETSR